MDEIKKTMVDHIDRIEELLDFVDGLEVSIEDKVKLIRLENNLTNSICDLSMAIIRKD